MAKRPLKRATDLSKEYMHDPEYAALYREVANEEIGAALRAVRENRGLSQREVAERMGVTRARVSQIESVEGTNLALEVLSRYAQAVGCQLDIALRDAEQGTLMPIFVPSSLSLNRKDSQLEPVA
jgi:transcriptional regulator with XRE-family HTH domain